MATEYRPIPRLAVGVYPLTNVTPFTYRDGVTYERLLHQLIDRMNTIIGEVNSNNQALFDVVIENMNITIDAVNAALGEQTDEVDQKLADLTDYVDIEVAKIVDMRAEMIEYRDETEEFRNQAETFSATTVELQDTAVAQLIATPGSDTQTQLDATVATLVATPGSDTQTQLNATIVDVAGVVVRTAPVSAISATVDSLDLWEVYGKEDTTWETPDSTGVVVHPSVRFFPNAFAGFHWWAAMTPYFNTNNQVENPCVVVSNDGLNWFDPPGISNPLYPAQPGGYNSDTHLVLGPDGKLHLFFRDYSDNPANPSLREKIMLMVSDDGISWSAAVPVIENNQSTRRIMSPSVWFDTASHKWVMLAVEILAEPREVLRYTADDPYGPWTPDVAPVVTDTPWDVDQSIWHIDAQLLTSGQVLLVAQIGGLADGSSGPVYLGLSDDAGQSFVMARVPVVPENSYRTCAVPVITARGLEIDLWVGGGDQNWGVKKTRAHIPTLTPDENRILEVAKYSLRVPPVVFADIFNRPDQSGLGTSTSGEAWTLGDGSLSVVDGEARVTVASNSWARVDPGVADVRVTVDFTSELSTGHQIVTLLRAASNTACYRMLLNGPSVQIQYFDNGATNLHTTTVYPPNNGEFYTAVYEIRDDVLYIDFPEMQHPAPPIPLEHYGSETGVGIQMNNLTTAFKRVLVERV